jgi:hypothetical protein
MQLRLGSRVIMCVSIVQVSPLSIIFLFVASCHECKASDAAIANWHSGHTTSWLASTAGRRSYRRRAVRAAMVALLFKNDEERREWGYFARVRLRALLCWVWAAQNNAKRRETKFWANYFGPCAAALAAIFFPVFSVNSRFLGLIADFFILAFKGRSCSVESLRPAILNFDANQCSHWKSLGIFGYLKFECRKVE